MTAAAPVGVGVPEAAAEALPDAAAPDAVGEVVAEPDAAERDAL